jgi:hypothetical protein
MFNLGDKVTVKPIEGISRTMQRYIGQVGEVRHTAMEISPYSGNVSQVIRVFFDRMVCENSDLFEAVNA